MKSNIKTLGEVINPIDERNVGLKTVEVLGISINKEFMPSVANIIGTDLSNYKLLRNGRFAFNSMHTGRDERLPIALFKRDDIAIVSPAYFMFEVKDKEIIDEDYLMMWFQRSEFDHLCWYMTDASVRGGLSWDDFCRIEINLPSIGEQRKIVHNYRIITDRINLLKRFKKNLYEQIQIIFKTICSSDLIPLSSLDGVQEISSGVKKFNGIKKYYATGDIDFDYKMNSFELVSYHDRPSRANMEPKNNSLWFAKMQNTNKYLFFNEFSKNLDDIILSTGFMGIKCDEEIFYYLLSFVFTKTFIDQKDRFATGTTQIAINSEALNKIMIPKPQINYNKKYLLLKSMFINIQNINEEIMKLTNFKEIQLSNIINCKGVY